MQQFNAEEKRRMLQQVARAALVEAERTKADCMARIRRAIEAEMPAIASSERLIEFANRRANEVLPQS